MDLSLASTIGPSRAATADAPKTHPESPTRSPAGESSHFKNLPRNVGRFRLLREIGHGGMGVVYEAEDTRLVRKVALKTLFALEGGKGIQDRFLREARIAGTLDHPNLVPVYDYGTIEGLSYYTMPLVNGLSLEAVIPFLHGRGVGSPPEFLRIPNDFAGRVRLVLRWLEGSLAGLEHAHGLGIVHRDLKPSNLILDANTAQLRITDFGMARAHHLTGLTQKGSLMGTVGYMSPEQIQRDLDSVGPGSDIYSMGVTLYRTLVDHLPYTAETMGTYMQQVVSSPPQLQREGIPSLPRDLLTILEKSLEKVPSLRYRSAQTFAEDLERFRGFEPINARPVGPAGRITRWARRKPATAGLASVLLIAVLVVGTLFRAQQKSSRILRKQEVEASVVAGNYASLTQDYEKALDRFGRALDLDAAHFPARMGRALALWESSGDSENADETEQALEDLRVAGEILPDLSSVHLLRGRFLRRQGDEAGARREERIAAELPPRIAMDWRLVGEIALLDGDCPTAIQHFTEAINRDPQMFWAILRRGMCFMDSGNLETARIDYEIATHLVPDHAFPHNNLANVLREQGDVERALTELQRALEIEPDNATIHFNYGEALLTSERTAEAERALRRSLEIDPLLINARNNLGLLLIDSGRDEEGLSEFREAIRNEESRENRNEVELLAAYTNLCDTYLSRKEPSAAADPCLQAVDMSPEDPDGHYNLATYRMLIGDLDGALESLERDVELGDTDFEYLLKDQAFAPLRSHHRFHTLLERMRSATGDS